MPENFEKRGGLLKTWLAASVLSLFVMAAFTAAGRGLRHAGAPQGIVSFELAGDPAGLDRVFAGWDAADRLTARTITLFDFGFIVLYATALASGALLFGRGLRRPAAAAAGAAGLLDAVENCAGLVLLAGSGNPGTIRLMSLAAGIKFALVLLVFLYIMCSGARTVFSLLSNPERA